MSAYTPKLAGSEPHKLAIDYAPKADMDLPAILRLKPTEPVARAEGAMRIKLQAAPREASSAVSASEAECRAYRKMLGSAATGEVMQRGDPELLAQIPRLKETLRALDSEMSSELEKRLAVHARILQLQGQQLTEVQKAVEQTVRQHKMHGKKHEVDAQHARDIEERLRSVEKVGQLHSMLHEETGKGVLEARKTMLAVKNMQHTNEIRDDLHHEVGQRVQKLQTSVTDIQKRSSLSEQVHEATASKVFGLEKKIGSVERGVTVARKTMQDLSDKSDMHKNVHMEVGKSIKDMQKQIDAMHLLHDQLSQDTTIASHTSHDKKHKKNHQGADAAIDAPGVVKATGLSTQSFASKAASDVDVRQMRSDIDALVAINKELNKKVQMQEEAVMSTSNIVRSIGKHVMDKKTEVAAAASVLKHDRVLSMFQTDLASSNARGQNRRK